MLTNNKENNRMSPCPFCKIGALTRGVKQQTHTYKNKTVEIHQSGDWCDKCPEGVLSAADIRDTDRQIRDFHSKVNGLLTSIEIRDIRARLSLTQKQAAH